MTLAIIIIVSIIIIFVSLIIHSRRTTSIETRLYSTEVDIKHLCLPREPEPKAPETIDCATCGCVVKKVNAVKGPDRIEVILPESGTAGYPSNRMYTSDEFPKTVVNDWYCKRCYRDAQPKDTFINLGFTASSISLHPGPAPDLHEAGYGCTTETPVDKETQGAPSGVFDICQILGLTVNDALKLKAWVNRKDEKKAKKKG